MNKIKKFFNIKTAYKFELGDLYALFMVLNVVLVMTVGLVASWVGIGIAVISLIIDFAHDRRINGIVMHLASLVLNIFFIVVYL